MKFKHYATDEIIEVKVIIPSTKHETIVEDIKTGKMHAVAKDREGRWHIKGTSFIKLENEKNEKMD